MSDTAGDRTIPLLRSGYRYLLEERHRRPGRPLVLRLLGRRTLVVAGPDGARLFYDQSRMKRRSAMPLPLAAMLFGRGAVHGLDGAAHAHRKAMFIQLLTAVAARQMADDALKTWSEQPWRQRAEGSSLPVFDAAVQVHGHVACRWVGLDRAAVPQWLPGDLAALIDGLGSVGPRFAAGVRARVRTGQWARSVISAVRSGQLAVADDQPLAVVAAQHDEHGRLLPERIAAVELINLLRPTVAVSYFAAFTARHLAGAELRARLRDGDDRLWESFAHEIRRYSPFVPLLAAKPIGPLQWHGAQLQPCTRVVLDVYGTLHDAQWWPDPESFDLQRFSGDPDPYRFIPQGGGDAANGHRCPGERTAIELIKACGRFLAGLEYGLVPETPRTSLSRMPSRAPDGGPHIVLDNSGA